MINLDNEINSTPLSELLLAGKNENFQEYKERFKYIVEYLEKNYSSYHIFEEDVNDGRLRSFLEDPVNAQISDIKNLSKRALSVISVISYESLFFSIRKLGEDSKELDQFLEYLAPKSIFNGNKRSEGFKKTLELIRKDYGSQQAIILANLLSKDIWTMMGLNPLEYNNSLTKAIVNKDFELIVNILDLINNNKFESAIKLFLEMDSKKIDSLKSTIEKSIEFFMGLGSENVYNIDVDNIIAESDSCNYDKIEKIYMDSSIRNGRYDLIFQAITQADSIEKLRNSFNIIPFTEQLMSAGINYDFEVLYFSNLLYLEVKDSKISDRLNFFDLFKKNHGFMNVISYFDYNRVLKCEKIHFAISGLNLSLRSFIEESKIKMQFSDDTYINQNLSNLRKFQIDKFTFYTEDNLNTDVDLDFLSSREKALSYFFDTLSKIKKIDESDYYTLNFEEILGSSIIPTEPLKGSVVIYSCT